MPGLFGVIDPRRTHVEGVGDLPMRSSNARMRSEFLRDPHLEWALGRRHLGTLQPRAQLTASDDVHVLLHGELQPAGHPAPEPAGTGQADRDVAHLRTAYGDRADRFVDDVDGAFCAAVVDTRTRRTLLATDPSGAYPLYWTVVNGALIFSSELSAVLKSARQSVQLDAEAVGDYLAFGFVAGTKTLATGVHLLPAGAVLSFEWDTGTVSVRRTYDYASAFREWTGTRDEYVEALRGAFQTAVHDAVGGAHRFGMSLSGGLDSRAILSTMNGEATTLSTYTLGVKGCADEVIAERLARMAGTQHTFFELDDRYLREFLPNLQRMVALTDGFYLSHGLTEMLALGFLGNPAFSVLVRGHGGELAKTNLAWPWHTDGNVGNVASTQDAVRYLLGRVNYISPGLDLRQVFTGSRGDQIQGAPGRSLHASAEPVSLSPADLCSYVYLTEFHRRSTIPSLELFREAVEVRLPFVDRRFLEILFQGRSEWRADTGIHRALTAAGDPAMLRVRNSNTGAPANAGPRTEFVLDKVNSLFKRLNLPGYRHYHNFQAWMREQLLASVETVLLSPESLDRGWLNEAGVRRLVDDTRHNRGDYSYLLQVLLILELWQRENL